MTDWRQIQARIRKAKTSGDPLAKLSELYQGTRDAMVAWELAAVEEKNGRMEQAVKWYTAAAQRFRRTEWKKKAEEALARLGIELPVESGETTGDRAPSSDVTEDSGASLALGEISAAESPETSSRESTEEPISGAADEFASDEQPVPAQRGASAGTGNEAHRPEGHKKRRRGRRGGRGRHRKAGTSPALPSQTFTPAPPAESAAHGISREPGQRVTEPGLDRRRFGREEMPAMRHETAEPQLPSERTARGRAGDPALASRMAHLESMLRRLLSSQLHRLDELEEAPAGPGVFILSDSDQITTYYVEACQTLRIGLGNLVRGGSGRASKSRGGRGYSDSGELKEKLAEHLGINQSKVAQYMKDHCVVRWIQLDEDAPHVAHFAIAVLRAPLNVE
ncbi:MAG TPA: hypothetical protein VFW94_03245 [Candidatus Acidoferrales bacterium]|nr:hypothetical protein [Candidatus Acidoferrales bacterium]